MKTTTSLIQEYKGLYDEGTLTLDEYNYLKKHLLDLGDAQFEEEGNILEASRQRVDNEKKEEKKRKLSTIGGVIVGIIFVVSILSLLIMGFKGCAAFFSDDDLGDYETYYEDDNGNGKLDNGEWNYTVDEDGNVVDIDDDLSNFE